MTLPNDMPEPNDAAQPGEAAQPSEASQPAPGRPSFDQPGFQNPNQPGFQGSNQPGFDGYQSGFQGGGAPHMQGPQFGMPQPPYQPRQSGGFGSIFSANFSSRVTPQVAGSLQVLAVILGVSIIGLGVWDFVMAIMMTSDGGMPMGFHGRMGYGFAVGGADIVTALISLVISVVKGLLVIGGTRVVLEHFVKADR